jgi:hypothetical protein
MNIAYSNPPMFVVETGQVVWEVRFLHDQNEYPAEPEKGLKYPAKAVTWCFITNQKDGIEWAGVARCSMTDQFSREEGRKHALANATQHMDKSYRRMIWNVYWIFTGHLDRCQYLPTAS